MKIDWNPCHLGSSPGFGSILFTLGSFSNKPPSATPLRNAFTCKHIDGKGERRALKKWKAAWRITPYLLVTSVHLVFPHHSVQSSFLTSTCNDSANIVSSWYIRGLVQVFCYAEFPRRSFHHFGTIVVVYIGSGMARRNFKHQPEKKNVFQTRDTWDSRNKLLCQIDHFLWLLTDISRPPCRSRLMCAVINKHSSLCELPLWLCLPIFYIRFRKTYSNCWVPDLENDEW